MNDSNSKSDSKTWFHDVNPIVEFNCESKTGKSESKSESMSDSVIACNSESKRESKEWIQNWFQGMNPWINPQVTLQLPQWVTMEKIREISLWWIPLSTQFSVFDGSVWWNCLMEVNQTFDGSESNICWWIEFLVLQMETWGGHLFTSTLRVFLFFLWETTTCWQSSLLKRLQEGAGTDDSICPTLPKKGSDAGDGQERM